MRPHHDTRALVRAAAKGDRDAFSRLVVAFQAMVFGCAYASVGESQAAEDISQEAFLDAYRMLPALREPAAFPGWLKRIVATRCSRYYRSRHCVVTAIDEKTPVPDTGPRPDERAVATQAGARLNKALRALPDHQRVAIVLFYLQEYSYAEVARFLEVPVSTVKKRLHDARENLRERMETMTADEIRAAVPDSELKAAQIRFLLDLSDLWSKGVLFKEAIRTAARMGGSAKVTECAEDAIRRVDGGAPLALALEESGMSLPHMVIVLIRHGEAFGCLEAMARCAAEYLREGAYRVAPDIFSRSVNPVQRLLRKARELGARELVIDPADAKVEPQVSRNSPVFRPYWVLPSGAVRDQLAYYPNAAASFDAGLKHLTRLDEKQTGEQMTGRLRVPLEPDAEPEEFPVVFEMHREGTVTRIKTGA